MTEIAFFHINSFDDRRTLVGILADNGYATKIEDRQDRLIPTRHEYYVHVFSDKERQGD